MILLKNPDGKRGLNRLLEQSFGYYRKENKAVKENKKDTLKDI